jgi:hypothetical protein
MPIFEWTFRGGDIFTLIGGISVAAAILYRRGGDDATVKITLKAMTDQLAEMKTELSEFGKAMTKLAVQETKIDLLMKWYDELRRGKGVIQE